MPLTDTELAVALQQNTAIAITTMFNSCLGVHDPLRAAVIAVTGSDEHAPPATEPPATAQDSFKCSECFRETFGRPYPCQTCKQCFTMLDGPYDEPGLDDDDGGGE